MYFHSTAALFTQSKKSLSGGILLNYNVERKGSVWGAAVSVAWCRYSPCPDEGDSSTPKNTMCDAVVLINNNCAKAKEWHFKQITLTRVTTIPRMS